MHLVLLESVDFTYAHVQSHLCYHEEQLRALTEGHESGKKQRFQLWKLGENLFLSSWGKQCENADTSGEFTGLQTLNEFLKLKVNPHRKHLSKSPAGVCKSQSGSSAGSLTGRERKWSWTVCSKRKKHIKILVSQLIQGVPGHCYWPIC